MGIPGPIVEERVMLLTYFPLAATGLALTTAEIRAWAFSTRRSGENLVFPTGAWMMAVLSTRNSTLPALISRIAVLTSKVTVPALGFGISPRGPRTFPSRTTDFI